MSKKIAACVLREKLIKQFHVHGSRSVGDLVISVGVGSTSIWRMCKKLREERLIHISGYTKKRQNIAAIYSIGDSDDAERPDIYVGGDPFEILPIPFLVLPFWHEHIFAAARSGQKGIAA